MEEFSMRLYAISLGNKFYKTCHVKCSTATSLPAHATVETEIEWTTNFKEAKHWLSMAEARNAAPSLPFASSGISMTALKVTSVPCKANIEILEELG